jgi:hypothetical protein
VAEPYSVSRVGDAWVIFCDGQPVLTMKNRRDANQCVRRATQLLAEMEARAGKKSTSDAPDDASGGGQAEL